MPIILPLVIIIETLHLEKNYIELSDHVRGMEKIGYVRIYNRETKKSIQVSAPDILKYYRKYHGFVDERKAIESHARNKGKVVHGWRAEFGTWIYILLTNTYVWYKHVPFVSALSNL